MKASDANTARVLIADDQEDVLTALRLLLKSEGYRIVAVNSPGRRAEGRRAGELRCRAD